MSDSHLPSWMQSSLSPELEARKAAESVRKERETARQETDETIRTEEQEHLQRYLDDDHAIVQACFQRMTLELLAILVAQDTRAGISPAERSGWMILRPEHYPRSKDEGGNYGRAGLLLDNDGILRIYYPEYPSSHLNIIKWKHEVDWPLALAYLGPAVTKAGATQSGPETGSIEDSILVWGVGKLARLYSLCALHNGELADIRAASIDKE